MFVIYITFGLYGFIGANTKSSPSHYGEGRKAREITEKWGWAAITQRSTPFIGSDSLDRAVTQWYCRTWKTNGRDYWFVCGGIWLAIFNDFSVLWDGVARGGAISARPAKATLSCIFLMGRVRIDSHCVGRTIKTYPKSKDPKWAFAASSEVTRITKSR